MSYFFLVLVQLSSQVDIFSVSHMRTFTPHLIAECGFLDPGTFGGRENTLQMFSKYLANSWELVNSRFT